MDYTQILSYLQGNTTQQDRNNMIEWIEESEAHKAEFAALRRIYDASIMSEDNHAAVASPKRRLLKWAAGIAAAAVIAVGLSHIFKAEPAPAPVPLLSQTVSTPTGHQSKTILSDGTVVWLNSGSELIFTEVPGKERRVNLKGEAYLEVAHDPSRPFIVETAQLKVKVLGTKFNVNAYDSAQSVVLIEGSVAVRDNIAANSMEMLPNEMFIFDAETGERTIKPVDSDKYVSWKEGYLLLDMIPLNEVLTRLQQFYGVEINFDAQESNWIPISGKLELRDGLETALNHLKLLAPITFSHEADGGGITIRRK